MTVKKKRLILNSAVPKNQGEENFLSLVRKYKKVIFCRQHYEFGISDKRKEWYYLNGETIFDWLELDEVSTAGLVKAIKKVGIKVEIKKYCCSIMEDK